MTSGKRMSRVVCLVDVFMIISPRLVDELILGRREQALKGCCGHYYLRAITALVSWGTIFLKHPPLTF